MSNNMLPRISAAFLVLTEQCNLRCTYCYEEHGTKRMTKEIATDGLEFLFRDSYGSDQTINVTLFGGEPTLEVDLIEHIFKESLRFRKQFERNITVAMVTNCTNMPDKLYNIIDRYMEDVDFQVQLSIDGKQESQDLYRITASGEGSFKLIPPVMEKWKTLFANHGMEGLSVHGCVNKKTLPRIYENFLFFREECGLKKIWFMPVTAETWEELDVSLYDQQLNKIYKYILNSPNPLKEAEYYAPLDRCFANWGHDRGKPCGAGMDFLSITPDGTLSPCHQMHFNNPQSAIGDIWSGIDEDKRRFFTQYDDIDFKCNYKYNCDHKFCYRCIAGNFQEKGCMLSSPFGVYCDLMLTDFKYQKLLKEYVENLRASEQTR